MSTFKICMGRVIRFLEFQNFTGSKPTFRIYVPSWLPTLVRKSRYQTHCTFLSNFETRDFLSCVEKRFVFDPWLKIAGLVPPISLPRGPLLEAFLSTRQNLGSQNYSENYIEFDNAVYALESGARKVRRFGR